MLSMVAAGLYLSFHGLGRISARVTDSLSSFWAMASFIAETIIFFVSGLVGEGGRDGGREGRRGEPGHTQTFTFVVLNLYPFLLPSLPPSLPPSLRLLQKRR